MNCAKPRGIRNNNPGNIRYNGTNWIGLDTPPSDPVFCRFVAPCFGVRAIVKILETYKIRGVKTVRQIILRWAPPNENDTDSYVKSVCSIVGCRADDIPKSIALLCRAIITHENGCCPYTDEQIEKWGRK